MMKKIRMNCTATLDETFADFLLSRRAKGLAEKTLESYSSQWKAVARHLDTGTDIAALQKADLDDMIVSMREAGLSPNSINSYMRVLKSFFSWCNEQGLTRLNVPLYKAEETVKETYSDAELTALLKKPDIRKTTFAEYRDWVIINFLLNCGSRAATVRAIQIRDVDLDGGVVFYRHTKNRKAQVIPLCSPMIAILREYGRYRGGERLAAIYRKVQHAAQLLPICNIIVNQHPSDNREKGLLFPTTVGIILHCFSGSSRRIFVM